MLLPQTPFLHNPLPRNVDHLLTRERGTRAPVDGAPPPPMRRQVGMPSVVADGKNFKAWAVRVCHKGRSANCLEFGS